MNKSVETKGFDLNSIVVKPRSYQNFVKGIISQNYNYFWQQANKRNFKLQNRSLEETYTILIKNQHLSSLSRQIHLSECIEIISGIFISEKMRMYRGFLLNLEKVSQYFYLFKKFADTYDIETLLKPSDNGLDVIQRTFTDLWGDSFPNEMIRPSYIKEEIKERFITKTQRMLTKQQKLVTTIRKIVRSSKTLNKNFGNFTNLSRLEILKSGLTGPLARSVGIVTPLINASTSFNHFSSSRYNQYATSQNSSPRGILEICTVELALALERMMQLLPKIYGPFSIDDIELKSGTFTSSFALSLGVNHLSCETGEGRIKYLKFIPFETGNLFGISKLITLNSPDIYHFILLFLNPEIELRY